MFPESLSYFFTSPDITRSDYLFKRINRHVFFCATKLRPFAFFAKLIFIGKKLYNSRKTYKIPFLLFY